MLTLLCLFIVFFIPGFIGFVLGTRYFDKTETLYGWSNNGDVHNWPLLLETIQIKAGNFKKKDVCSIAEDV